MSDVSPPSRESQPPLSIHERQKRSRKGPLAWMAANSVAANLLMFLLLIGGGFMAFQVKQEVFPAFDLDMVTIGVAYPGASPAEVEQGVVLAVEEAVRGLDGVKEVRSNAGEGAAATSVELQLGTDSNKALADIKAAVDRITSFPADAERPIVSLAALRNRVIDINIYGEIDRRALRDISDRIREELLAKPNITYVETGGLPPLEISVEVDQQALRAHGLTIEQVAQTIGSSSIELPAGTIKTDGGDVLLRTSERKLTGREFEELVVLNRPDGTRLTLADIATVRDGFQDTGESSTFNGKPAAFITVFRVGDQTPIDVADTVKAFVEEQRAQLPSGVKIETFGDRSQMFRERVDLLQRNALLGLVLVLITLGLFLEVRLAFWVTLGIPISFVGAMLFMPMTDVSINMISLFAFIVTLGIVVDDAIVVGEAIFHRRAEGLSGLDAAIAGLRDVAAPVVFSVLTTVVAFAPLLFVPGVMGKFFKVIPAIVISVLLLSLLESLLILPAHLAHSSQSRGGVFGAIDRFQSKFSNGLERFIQSIYKPTVVLALKYRFLVIGACVAMLLSSCGLVAGGRIHQTFLPKIESDSVNVSIKMPFGTPVDQTKQTAHTIVLAAERVLDGYGDDVCLGIAADVGYEVGGSGPGAGQVVGSGGHLASVSVKLVSSDARNFTAAEFVRKWRHEVGDVPGIDTIQFSYSTGANAGAAIDIELSHHNMDVLQVAADRLTARYHDYAGVYDIENGFSEGKPQFDLKLKPEARALGITQRDLARQVRSAFYGAEAVRQQRDRDEVRVYVRYPEKDRRSLSTLENLVIRTPEGGEIPLSAAAEIVEGQSYTTIRRVDGRRIVSVTAEVEEGTTNAGEVIESLEEKVLPDLLADTPGLSYGVAGAQQEQGQALNALFTGLGIALIVMFALMAIPFKSYLQPVIIMAAIPFGWIGAFAGHLLMNYDLSIMSMMGIVALSGVVVNDSLVMITTVNENRRLGMPLVQSVVEGATRRFRPIMLTSLTTFFGLAPMILETSVQARFLIPMAISLGFGVMFATFIILVLVPCLYVTVEKMRDFFFPLKHDHAQADVRRLTPDAAE